MMIEIAYARSSTEQHLLKLEITSPCSVEKALQQSNILTLFSEINLSTNKVGIFGQEVSLSTPLKEGDRIEIYRPLLIDPMTKRRLLERKQKSAAVPP